VERAAQFDSTRENSPGPDTRMTDRQVETPIRHQGDACVCVSVCVFDPSFAYVHTHAHTYFFLVVSVGITKI